MSEDIELMSVSKMERLYVKGSHREMFDLAIKLKQRVEELETEVSTLRNAYARQVSDNVELEDMVGEGQYE